MGCWVVGVSGVGVTWKVVKEGVWYGGYVSVGISDSPVGLAMRDIESVETGGDGREWVC